MPTSLHLTQFTRNYNLHLLPASHSSIVLGNLVWKPFWGKPKLSHPGMPNHISNALYDAGLFTKTQWHDDLKSFEAKICKRAALAKINVAGANKVAVSVFEGMGLGFEREYLVETEISELCTKVMTNKQRVNLDKHLEKLEPKLQRLVFRNPRKTYVITELFYGNLTIKVEKSHEFAFEQQMMQTNWPLKANLYPNKSNEYIFSHNEVPFAYKMERIHRFNG